MFNSASVASLEMVASTLEVTCDQVLTYLQSNHWKTSLEHGACKNVNDITICMEDFLLTETFA